MAQTVITKSSFFKLKNTIQNYVWGSPTLLPQLFSFNNEQHISIAELWMGAHSGGCSLALIDGHDVPLSDLIEQDKSSFLSEKTALEFGELPYLLKVLTAECALSIQVHPDKPSAQIGYQREQEAGIKLSDFNRNYKDPNHKPELVYALGNFQAMNGFRHYKEILTLFTRVDVSVLRDLMSAFEKNQTAQGLETFFVALLQLENDQKQQAIRELAQKAENFIGEETFELVLSLIEQYPEDVGVFSPLFLNVITLQPGQSMYLTARTPHAYIKGACIEIMANSDNVLRAGLTNKYIDITELVSCTSFEPKPFDTLLLEPEKHEGRAYYPVTVDDFALEVIEQEAQEVAIEVSSAEIILALEGETVLFDSSGQAITLQLGESAFVPAYTKSYKIRSKGKVIRAFNR